MAVRKRPAAAASAGGPSDEGPMKKPAVWTDFAAGDDEVPVSDDDTEHLDHRASTLLRFLVRIDCCDCQRL